MIAANFSRRITDPCWAVTFPERPGHSVAAMGAVQLPAGRVPAAGVPGPAACGGDRAVPAAAFPGITALPASGRP